MATFYTRKASDYYNEGNREAHRKVLSLVGTCHYEYTVTHTDDQKYNKFRIAGNELPQWLLDKYGDVIMKELPGEKLIRDFLHPKAETTYSSVDVLSVMSDEAPTTTNASGGKQSHLGAAFELLPPDALTQVAVILEHGANKYSAWNWLRISRNDHIRHALGHIFAYISKGDIKDLQHAACRLLFALETQPNHEQEKHYHTKGNDKTST